MAEQLDISAKDLIKILSENRSEVEVDYCLRNLINLAAESIIFYKFFFQKNL